MKSGNWAVSANAVPLFSLAGVAHARPSVEQQACLQAVSNKVMIGVGNDRAQSRSLVKHGRVADGMFVSEGKPGGRGCESGYRGCYQHSVDVQDLSNRENSHGFPEMERLGFAPIGNHGLDGADHQRINRHKDTGQSVELISSGGGGSHVGSARRRLSQVTSQAGCLRPLGQR